MLNRLKSFLSSCYLKVLPLFSILLVAACSSNSNKNLEETQKLFDSPEGCFSCQFFKIIYNVSATISSEAYKKMSDAAFSLLIIGLMIWIIWHVLGLLTTLREPNLSKFWVDLFHHLFKAGLIAILLSSKDHLLQFINTVIEPIEMIFIELSSKMLTNNWYSHLPQSITIKTSSYVSAPGFSLTIADMMENLIYRITLSLNIGRILGLRIMLQPDIQNFIIGFVTTFQFLLMSLIFPFYLIDGFIRLALVFVLLPLFMVSWVFQWSKHWAKKAWDIFIGAFAQIMVSCVFVAIAIAVFEGFIEIRGYGYLLNSRVQNVDAIFRESANRLSFSFLSFLMISFYLYNLSKNIPPLVSHFTGAPAGNVMSGAIERFKKAFRAIALAGLALTATAVGLGPVAKVAVDQAKKDAEGALKGGK